LTVPIRTSTINTVMNKKQIAEMFLNILEKQTFESWHEREFQDYITGEGTPGAPTKQQILKELEDQIDRELRYNFK